MRKALIFSSFLGVTALASVAGAAPVLRVQVDQHGDFLLVGNTLGYECAAGTPAPVVGTIGACGTTGLADSAPDIFWRSDSPANGQAEANTGITVANARSTAVLTVPVGATVTHAFLYWSGIAATADTGVTVDRPGTFTQSVTAIQSYASTGAYQSVADVTSLVQAQGSGAYRVSGINTANVVNVNQNVNFAGWWLVVLYDRPSDPPRNIALFEGLDAVSGGAPQNTLLSGFLVPPAFANARLGVVTFEGDASITGDQFFFNGGAALSDAQNPVDNFFNGTRSALGAAVSVAGDLPQLTGTAGSMSGMDIDIVDITPKLTAGQTSAPISATSTGDQYYLAGFVTSIPTFRPDFGTSQKTVIDQNGAPLLAGDTLEYTVVATNTGNDTAVNTVMSDALPTGVTFVPGSIQITAGPNAGAKTDASGDDQCEYVSATRTVVCRLGAGATATQGGTMAVGEFSTVKFQVKIDAGVTGSIDNQAVINASGQLGAPATDTPTDGNGPASGSPPTSVVVDGCASDASCSAPTPYCDTASSPKLCVECLQDSHCPGNLPTCDTNTHTCTCVPSGAETCDGKDNDCNGTIDDGFNVGQGCTVGVGECAANGTIQCSGGTSACNAVAGTPSNETCDGKDNDCDGTPDDGNPGGGVACTTGLSGVCSAGTTSCTSGAIACNANIQPGSQTETCNGLDDDCNGTVDDGFNVGQSCTAGVGACLANGSIVCSAGAAVCNAVAGTPKTEVCGDNVDDDCNGTLDNGCADTDGDGIFDDVETQNGTDPNDADSDDDGVIDGDEPKWNEDSDGDGLINALDPDSDDDGLYDGTELGLPCTATGTDATAGHCIADADQGATKTDPLLWDTDGGGASDGSEDANLNGAPDSGETDPTAGQGSDDTGVTDTDGDGLSDALESFLGSNPNDADTDDDGLLDGKEHNPADDTDGDGLINVLDVDSDNDALYDGTETGKNCDDPATDKTAGHCVADGDNGATTTSSVMRDTDHGGVMDGNEDANLNGVLDGGETDPTKGHGSDDGTITDSDGDGLSDALEGTLKSDPNDADSDDDGVLDGDEWNLGDDTDGDGLINVLDADSDGDGLFDGTERGKGCGSPATDAQAGKCTADADSGATTTNPLLADTDKGGVSDGDEDTNKNGVVDAGERDPNDPSDDNTGTGGTGGQAGAGGQAGGGTGGAGGSVTGGTGGAAGSGGALQPSAAQGTLEGGGCNCSLPGGRSSTPAALALLGLAFAALGRRRQRRS